MGLYANKANVIAQGEDPGAVGAGAVWIDTTNDVTYFRNSNNTGWNLMGATLGDMLAVS